MKLQQAQHWGNQRPSSQDGNGRSCPETILAVLRRDEDQFQTLMWAANVAAWRSDTIVAFLLGHQRAQDAHLIGPLQFKTRLRELNIGVEQRKILKAFCDAKQVHLDVKRAKSGNDDLEMIGEASAVHATMVVMSPGNNRPLWQLEHTASLLVQQLPLGCSIVVVKAYRVLFYKENCGEERRESEPKFAEPCHGARSRRRKGVLQPIDSTFRPFSCGSSPLWQEAHDNDMRILASSKIWPHQAGRDSPSRILDGPYLSSGSDVSSPASSCGALSPSLSRKGLLSCVSARDDSDLDCRDKASNCLSLWRNGSIRRSVTFPSRMTRLSSPVDCASMHGPFKSYVNTLWCMESTSHESSPASSSSEVCQSWRCFSLEELVSSTNNFNPENMVGSGGHSEVYKGMLWDGRPIAVKRLTSADTEEVKEQAFLTELGIIGHVSHPNTTSLIGFCVEEGLHLIFDFSTNGSLATHLHGRNNSVLEWSLRYKIAVGTARGLHYLHTNCPRRIIHRDIKASNILLGPDFEPQISDFGLAKWLPNQCTQLCVSPIEGTFGYLAPEYFMHGIVNEKTDVFAFGVLLLELITGREPIDYLQQSLVIWARPLLESSSSVDDLVDPRLAGVYVAEEAQSMVIAAAFCVQTSDTHRPCMGQVLQLLAGGKTDCVQCSSSSREYSSAHYLSDLNRHREIALQF